MQTISAVAPAGTVPNSLFTSTVENGAFTSDVSKEAVAPLTVQKF